MTGKTIRIYLVDGSPTGILTAEIMNWTGKVTVGRRARLADMAQAPGCQKFWSCRFLTPPDQIAARYSLGCDCRSCLASTFRPVGVSIFSASSFSSRCSAS